MPRHYKCISGDFHLDKCISIPSVTPKPGSAALTEDPSVHP